MANQKIIIYLPQLHHLLHCSCAMSLLPLPLRVNYYTHFQYTVDLPASSFNPVLR